MNLIKYKKLLLFLGFTLISVIYWMLNGTNQYSQLSAMEALCVGTWSFISPSTSTTLIVYKFSENRRVHEHHYYLNSSNPMVPRITMVGQWRVEPDNQMVVEPSDGFIGMVDDTSGKIRKTLDDERQIARPVLRRLYWIVNANEKGISIRSSRGNFTMKPFNGDSSITQKKK